MIKLSRSRLELFLECPRCFWLTMVKKCPRPKGFPFTLNMAVDSLLKKEFDHHRNERTPHKVMKENNIDAVPFQHEHMDTWRNNFSGVRFEHKQTGFLFFGAVDDIWINPKDELHVVEYKATGAKERQVFDFYRRQIEIYQYLLRHNGFDVSPTGYFLFAHVNKDKGFGDAKLSFDTYLESCNGDDSWVEEALTKAKKCIEGNAPNSGADCDYCRWHFQQQS